MYDTELSLQFANFKSNLPKISKMSGYVFTSMIMKRCYMQIKFIFILLFQVSDWTGATYQDRRYASKSLSLNLHTKMFLFA